MAATIGVAAEIYYSLELLREKRELPHLRSWRAAVAGRMGADTRPLTSLVPVRGPGLDLLALMGDVSSLDHAVDNLLHAPVARLRREFEGLDFHPGQLPWARRVSEGDREALRELAEAVRACHRLTVEPYWHRGRAELVALATRCANLVLEGGVDLLLRSVCAPLVRWRPPVLEAPYPRRVEVRLQGRGLIITPTVFSKLPVSLLWDPLDTTQPPRLTVPALRRSLTGTGPGELDDSTVRNLESLLGRTRAAALQVTAEGCTTTELARRLNVTAAAASQHATVLRNTDLITTSRRGGSVLHFITPLGLALLRTGTLKHE
ncbi:ArsR/SmtB family transcription factor [Streptomyces justiciae]|uniref:Winged helix-turn-helix domain-containing protein n=1 Tax=Streptomyces justiciae TaxID=2780140 RepID=A0ABU3LWZ0_9ACTN|nr:winged helix-turn-helix domain-containing protein [Streptomyces justiciae]MDT7843311.1 winged helix-turn-helix domain-containing protein [Streptomyces justiciae]